eukprot:UN08232
MWFVNLCSLIFFVFVPHLELCFFFVLFFLRLWGGLGWGGSFVFLIFPPAIFVLINYRFYHNM